MIPTRATPQNRPDTDSDELAVLEALVSLLRDKRRALMDGDVSAQAMVPLWQPLLDRLAPFTARRASGSSHAPSALLRARADALRQEYEGLQHTLRVWSDALRLARDKVARRRVEPVYGRTRPSGVRGSLGRG